MMIYNPAYTSYGDATNAMLLHRSQWSDFKGAPQLTLFTLDGNFNLLNKKVSLGLGLINDRTGINSRTGGDLYYSYKLKLKEDMNLLFGASLGIIDQTIDFSKAILETTTDPTLFSDAQHKATIDANAGFAFIWKKLEVGAAIPNIIGNQIKYTNNTNVRAYYTEARHYMASAKYHCFIAKEKGISIAPQALIRFVPNTPFQFDGTVNIDWKSKLWIGTTYKSGYAMTANAGFCLDQQLSVGYSYDFIIGNLGNYAGTSQEIMIDFKLGKNKKPVPADTDTKPQPENAVPKNQ
jgi:type IX secretion system PorP/SprF family membrane protein